MPRANVTSNGTATPVIAASQLTGATQILLQNHEAYDMYYLIGAPVTVGEAASAGLRLKAHGGSAVVPGAAARLPIYCCHAEGSGVTGSLTYQILTA